MWSRILLFYLVFRVSCALYASKDNIVALTDQNFDSVVVKSDQFWVVEFYSPGCPHCVNFASEYKKAANALKGIVKVGAVDASVHHSISQRYQIRGLPTVMIFGSNKKKPTDYKGERSAGGLIRAVNSEITNTISKRLTPKAKSNPKTDNAKSKSKKNEKTKGKSGGDGMVVKLTDQNFEKLVLNSEHAWMVEFFAPWCGHCKRLEPEWAEAAKRMAGKVKFGAIDVTANRMISSKFGIEGFPTIKFFGPGSTENDAKDCVGIREAVPLVEFAENMLENSIPPPKAAELTEKKVLNEACNGKQLCVLAFLPHLIDCQSKCRYSHIDMLNLLSKAYKGRNFGWVWMESGAQPDIEATFEIGGFGYPALAVFSPRKMKYSILKGSFDSKSIKEFLDGISYGRSAVFGIEKKHLDKDGGLKVAKIEAWNGKNAEVPKLEEEPKTEL